MSEPASEQPNPEHVWESGWEQHEKLQRRRLASLSLTEKIRWLEETQRLLNYLQRNGGTDRSASERK